MTFRGGFFFRNAGLMRTGATHYLNQLRVIVELPECNVCVKNILLDKKCNNGSA